MIVIADAGPLIALAKIDVAIQYKFQIVFIRFVDTHQDYDQVDAAAV